MFLVIGLGNPGKQYKYTRHNLGFMIVKQLTKSLNITFKKRKLFWIATTNYNGKEIIFLLPMTYMNLSGKAVNFVMNKYKIDLSHILIICDDINLPFGKIRIRNKGSDGGHNGLASIIDYLGTKDFPRLRIGICSEYLKDHMVEFVLSPFAATELEKIDEVINSACQVVWSFINDGIIATMNKYN